MPCTSITPVSPNRIKPGEGPFKKFGLGRKSHPRWWDLASIPHFWLFSGVAICSFTALSSHDETKDTKESIDWRVKTWLFMLDNKRKDRSLRRVREIQAHVQGWCLCAIINNSFMSWTQVTLVFVLNCFILCRNLLGLILWFCRPKTVYHLPNFGALNALFMSECVASALSWNARPSTYWLHLFSVPTLPAFHSGRLVTPNNDA